MLRDLHVNSHYCVSSQAVVQNGFVVARGAAASARSRNHSQDARGRSQRACSARFYALVRFRRYISVALTVTETRTTRDARASDATVAWLWTAIVFVCWCLGALAPAEFVATTFEINA